MTDDTLMAKSQLPDIAGFIIDSLSNFLYKIDPLSNEKPVYPKLKKTRVAEFNTYKRKWSNIV